METIAAELIAMKEADLAFRDHLIQNGEINEGYHPEMEALHLKNAQALEAIIDQVGYPSPEKVGVEASEAAWLIVQHAISSPNLMRRFCSLLASEALVPGLAGVAKGAGNPIQLAYLSDRIAVFEDRLQLYGTQFDWDEDDRMSPLAFDDLGKVEERRKAIGLRPLEEQIAIMRNRPENQRPPKNQEQRKRTYNAWRRRVGWT